MTRSRKRRTAAPAPVRQNLPAVGRALVASIDNDITVPVYSRAIGYQDETLIQQGGGRGLKIYDEIERDPRAYAMLQKRKKTLIGRSWVVEPGGEGPLDQDAAALVEECLDALPFDQICEDLLDATLKGFAVSEIIWDRAGGRIRPAAVVTHDQRRFLFDREWQLRLRTWTHMLDGEPLPERKFIVHRVGVKGNNPYGLGLGPRLFWPVLFKREGVAFWLHYLEKFAAPTVWAQTPYGQISDEQQRLLQTLRDIRGSSAITVPVGTELKFLEAARTGSVTYENFLAYWDKEISICVTGESLTTEITGGGSRAAAQTHAEILELLVDSDGDLLSATLRSTLLAWIVDYNLPGAAVPQVWRPRPENELEAATVVSTTAAAASARVKAIEDVRGLVSALEGTPHALEVARELGGFAGLSDDAVLALLAPPPAPPPPAVPVVPGTPVEEGGADPEPADA